VAQDGGSDSSYCGPTENTACATIQQAIDNISLPHTMKTSPCVCCRWAPPIRVPKVGKGCPSSTSRCPCELRGGCGDDGLSRKESRPVSSQRDIFRSARLCDPKWSCPIKEAVCLPSMWGELYFLDDMFDNNVATLGWGGALNAYNVNTLGIGGATLGITLRWVRIRPEAASWCKRS